MKKTDPQIEILHLAIAREADAYNLYMKLSQWVQDSQMKEVFESFAQDELEHKARLEFELMKLGIAVQSAGEVPDRQDDEEGEPEERIFDMDFKAALLFAIKKERKALRLYIDLAAMAKDKVGREMFLTLAEDEAMHEARFEVEYNILMRKHPKS